MKARTAMPWKQFVPEPLKAVVRPWLARFGPNQLKYDSELLYWRNRWEKEGHAFSNAHYQRTMLGMAGEADAGFLQGKIVADFGCGPRGSLCWADTARLRIGIDVLADAYAQFGIASHNICYVCSTEKRIPLPSGYIDVLYTLNAIDHVDQFEIICAELLRILSPGGIFLGSFNLDEPTTECEPQTLTEARVREHLLDPLKVSSYRIAAQGKNGDTYGHFFDGSPAPTSGRRYLWVRATKP